MSPKADFKKIPTLTESTVRNFKKASLVSELKKPDP